MITKNQKVLALVEDEMSFVRGMSLDELDVYVESLLVRIINGLDESEINERFEELENV